MVKTCIVCKRRKEMKKNNNVCDECKEDQYRNLILTKLWKDKHKTV